MTFRELESYIKAGGWRLKTVCGSHYQYVHHSKPGKVTIPYHRGDLSLLTVRSICKQAGMQSPR